RSVFSMLPDGIRNASTRKVRRKNQTMSATTMDLVHSQTQVTKDRGEAELRAVIRSSLEGPAEKYNRGSLSLAWRTGKGFEHLVGVFGRVGHAGPMAADSSVRSDPHGRANDSDGLFSVEGLLAVRPVLLHHLVIRIGE